MRKFFVLGLAVATAGAVFAAVALADNNTSTVTQQLNDTSIPAGKYQAEAAHIIDTTVENGGGTATAPTKMPDPTSHITQYFDHAVKVNANGLPQCNPADIENTTTTQAEAACGSGSGNNAEVTPSHGSATVCVSSGTEGASCDFVVSGIVTAYNGTKAGARPRLLIHTYVPAFGITNVIVGVFKSTSLGDFKKKFDAPVPLLAGGAAALTDVDFTIDRDFVVSGKTKHYLSATCDDALWESRADFTYSTANGNAGGSDTATDTQACTAS